MAQNLLSDNQADVETDTTGFILQGSGSLVRSTDEQAHGVASLKIDTGGLGASQGARTDSADVDASATYTASVYLKGTGTVRLNLEERNAGDKQESIVQTAIITLTSSWVRYEISSVFGASGVAARIIVMTDIAQTITFYMDKLQIEKASAATLWRLPSKWSARNVGRDLVVI